MQYIPILPDAFSFSHYPKEDIKGLSDAIQNSNRTPKINIKCRTPEIHFVILQTTRDKKESVDSEADRLAKAKIILLKS